MRNPPSAIAVTVGMTTSSSRRERSRQFFSARREELPGGAESAFASPGWMAHGASSGCRLGPADGSARCPVTASSVGAAWAVDPAADAGRSLAGAGAAIQLLVSEQTRQHFLLH